MRRAAIAAVLVVVAMPVPVLCGADAPSAGGHWEGAIRLPGMELVVRVDLAAADSAWRGTIDIPAQGAKSLPLSGIEVDGASVGFAIQGVPGAPTFKGTLSADGKTIAGDFSQGGQTFPFVLERKADPGRAAAQSLDGFTAFVEGAMKDWKVPGAAVAIVRDDKVVFAGGLGLRDVKRGLPVTPDTLFAIGSASKAFTVMVLGMLADEGKISWDTPVKTYLPTFRLKDDFARERMTPRDLVTHRSGLPRHDLVWYNAPLSRKEIFDRLQYLEPNTDFRSKWQYQNLMFMTAGYLAGEVAGTTWEDLVRTRILEPLAMTSSNFSVKDSQKAPDFALPYQEKDKVVREIPFRNITTVGPAGSINSSIRDMAQWALLHVGKGKVGDRRLISENGIAEMHRPQMVLADPPQDPEIFGRSYALGWFAESYRGRLRVHHGGNIDGFSAMVTFLPREGLGVVVLTNLDGNPLPEILARHAIDRLLGLEPIDWNLRLLKRREEGEKADTKAKEKAGFERKTGTHPAHPLDEYLGEYENPAYGVVSVARDGAAALRASFHAIPMRLEHWHYETFRAAPEDPALSEDKLFVLFVTNAKGDVDALSLPFEPQAPEIVFSKKPPARLSDPAFLKTLAGVFTMPDNPSFTVTFAVKGDGLTATIPGQPEYHLEPYRGSEFRIRELTGFGVRFVLDAKGALLDVLLVQPDGVYSLKKKE